MNTDQDLSGTDDDGRSTRLYPLPQGIARGRGLKPMSMAAEAYRQRICRRDKLPERGLPAEDRARIEKEVCERMAALAANMRQSTRDRRNAR